MIKYDYIVREVLETQQTIDQVAKKYNIHKTTLSRYVREAVNIQSTDDVIRWCKNPNVTDIRKIISARGTSTKPIYNAIIEQTSFLPASSPLRERLYYIEHSTTHAPLCGCGKSVGWNTTTQKGFNRFCGDPTCETTLASANTKRESTNMRKRGVRYACLDDSVREKRDATMLKRYGSISFNGSSICHTTKSVLSDANSLKELYSNHLSTFAVAKELGVSQAHVSNCMQRLGIKADKHNSGFENEIFGYISTVLELPCGKTRSIIPPQEIDIFIPSHNVGIECDGIYWHSDNYKSRSYHIDKTTECMKAGVRLIHIFESEYTSKPDIVKSRLSAILGKNGTIGARQCSVQQISSKKGNEFFNATHIQGGCKTMSTILGLYHNGELVACMGFSKSRFTKQADCELVRYSSKLFTSVVGGASKLFNAFRKLSPASTVVSYSDIRWNTGSMYKQLGFTHSHISSPNYFYFKNGYVDTLMSRTMFQKHKLPGILNVFDESLSEHENMKNNEYSRIWDCGNSVWMFTP